MELRRVPEKTQPLSRIKLVKKAQMSVSGKEQVSPYDPGAPSPLFIILGVPLAVMGMLAQY